MAGFPVVGGGGGGGVWTQTGELIAADDDSASVTFGGGTSTGTAPNFGAAGGNALAQFAVGLASGSANTENSFAAAQGETSSFGNAAAALAGGFCEGPNDFAANAGSSANSFAFGGTGGASAFGGGQANNDSSFAIALGIADGGLDFAVGNGSFANSGLVGISGIGSVAMALGQTTADGCVAIGQCVVDLAGSYKMGIDTVGPLVSVNADGAGTLELDAGTNQVLTLGNVPTQSTVGAAGGADVLPLSPSAYFLIDVEGLGQVAIPAFAPF
jgi:hypothetical protein